MKKIILIGLGLCYGLTVFGQQPKSPAIAQNVAQNVAQNKVEKIDKDTVKVEVNPDRTSDSVPPGQELVNIDFPEPTEIKDIIMAVSLWTGKNVIIDRQVNGKVQIISPKKVTKEEAYQAFLSALNMLGLTTVETGKVIKIMPIRTAVKGNLKTFLGSDYTPRTDEIITQIVPLKYIDARQIQSTLSRMVNSQTIIAYEPTNTLIISDSGYKVRRLLSILKLLDVQGQQPKVAIVPIKYADAKSVADKVKQIFAGASKTSKARKSYLTYKIIVDERSNSVAIFGPPRTIQDVKVLVKKFDLPIDDPSRQASIHVRPLDYADAKKLASTLSALTGKSSSSTRRRSPVRRSVRGTAANANEPAAVAELEGNVKITADESSNSLLITGSRSAYEAINSIIRKLDIRRSQVYVEADILDILLDDNFTFKSSVFAGAPSEQANIATTWEAGEGIGGLIAAARIGSETGITSATAIGDAVNVFKNDFTVGILSNAEIDVPGIGTITPGALISMVKTDSNVRTISTPQILTANNEEASINVGRKIYLETSQSNPTTGAVTKSLEKEKINLELNIKPNISHSNYVTLNTKITQESLGNEVGGQISINSRKSSQIVTVKNKQTIVISGLVSNTETETFRKIPLLGDIPVLGWLFRNSIVRNLKSNLVIFLTPYIIHGAQDLANVYEEKIKYRNEFLEKVYGVSYKQSDFYASLPQREDGEYKESEVDQMEKSQRMNMLKKMYDSSGYPEEGSEGSESNENGVAPSANFDTSSDDAAAPASSNGSDLADPVIPPLDEDSVGDPEYGE